MKVSGRAIARRALTALWMSLLVGIVALVAGIQLAPHVGRQVFVIRGGSMAPAIPLGAVALVQPGGSTTVGTGDIVTIRQENGVFVTHRVVRVVGEGAGRSLELKGDANEQPDAALVPSSAVVGEVVGFVPWAGYLVAMLSMPTGLISVLSAAGCLLLAAWSLEDERYADEPDEAGSAAAGRAGRPGEAAA